jgi:hypothetical protein
MAEASPNTTTPKVKTKKMTVGAEQPTEKVEPKEETKENVKKMSFKSIGRNIFDRAIEDFNSRKVGDFNLNIFGDKKNLEGTESDSKLDNLTPKQILGEIYKALVKVDAYRKIQYEDTRISLKLQEFQKTRKNREIIKALKGFIPKRKVEVPKEKPDEANTKTSGTSTTQPIKPKAGNQPKPASIATPSSVPAPPPVKTAPPPVSIPPVTPTLPVPPAAPPAPPPAKPSTPVQEPPSVQVPKEPPKEVAPPVIPKNSKGTDKGTENLGGIGASESGKGSYDVSFGDILEKGALINKSGLKTPEQTYGKKLTEMTLQEVYDFQKSRPSGKNAVGKYQFVNRTLFDKDGNIQNSFASGIPGITLDSKFTPDLQDKLARVLLKEQQTALKQSGIQINAGSEKAAWYIGAGALSKVKMAVAQDDASRAYQRQNGLREDTSTPLGERTIGEVLKLVGLGEIVKKNPELLSPQLSIGGKDSAPNVARNFESIMGKRVKKPEALYSTKTDGENLLKKSNERKQNKEKLLLSDTEEVVEQTTNVIVNHKDSSKQKQQVSDIQNAYTRKSNGG